MDESGSDRSVCDLYLFHFQKRIPKGILDDDHQAVYRRFSWFFHRTLQYPSDSGNLSFQKSPGNEIPCLAESLLHRLHGAFDGNLRVADLWEKSGGMDQGKGLHQKRDPSSGCALYMVFSVAVPG